jgi:lipopolysaccharide biosynthesis regulator YciM
VHIGIEPPGGGLLDALGWDPDLNRALKRREQAMSLEHLFAEHGSLSNLLEIAAAMINRPDLSSECRAVALTLIERYVSAGAQRFETYDPMTRA